MLPGFLRRSCSKLIYLAYHGVDWPVKQSFGRTTFTPDDVAVNVFAKDALELVSFYHNGGRIGEAPGAVMATLMRVTE